MKSDYLCGSCRKPLEETTERQPDGQTFQQLTCLNPVCPLYQVKRDK